MNILQYGVCVCVCVCVEHTSPSSPVKYIHLFDTNLPPTRICHIHHMWETIFRQSDSSAAHKYSVRQRYFSEEQKQFDAFLESSSNTCSYIYVLNFDCMYCCTDRGILLPFPEGKQTCFCHGVRWGPAPASLFVTGNGGFFRIRE